MENAIEWVVNKVRPVIVFRVYNGLFAFLMVALMWSTITEPSLDFGGKPLPRVDAIFVFMLAICAVCKTAAVLSQREEVYRVAFFLVNITLSILAFVYLAYAIFDITPYIRFFLLTFILMENYLLFPYLIREVEVDKQLQNARHLLPQDRTNSP